MASTTDLGDGGTNDLIAFEVIRSNQLQAWFLVTHLVDTLLVRDDGNIAAPNRHVQCQLRVAVGGRRAKVYLMWSATHPVGGLDNWRFKLIRRRE
jgi:hypothetical protein